MVRWLVASCAVVLCAFVTRAEAITIDPGAYTGRYYINGVGGPYFGGQTIALGQGTYFLDLGAEIGGSGFSFDVDATGGVAIDPSLAAASARGDTINFNTTSVAIHAGSYTGRYFLSIFGTAVEYHGDQTVVLLPGLSYTLDDGAEIGGSDFVFSLDASGIVSTSSPAASGSGSTLSLNTVAIQIDPRAYLGTYYVQSFVSAPFVGPKTLNVVPGLTYAFDDTANLGNPIGSSEFLFDVDAAGNVSTMSGAAFGGVRLLTLNNIVMHITDGCAAPYSISGYGTLTGSMDVVLIPTLLIAVVTPTGGEVLVPTSDFTATIGCVTLTTASPYTASVQPPIKADGTSVFKANRGVVPVKFTLSVNGAATCQLPAATISLTRTSGASAGVVNQSDYLMPSDNGAAFRVDSCQYVYNLGASALGAGQYVVQISIGGVAVGSARFGLN